MKNGYNIHWTDNALSELEKAIEYLTENFTDREIRKLALKIDDITNLMAQNPNIFPKLRIKTFIK